MANLARRKLLRLPALAPFAADILGNTPDRKSVIDLPDDQKASAARDKIRQRYFPDVVLYTHEGKRVNFYQDLIKGRIVTINVMYATCKGVCPGITANLVKVQKLLGKRVGREVFMYSITLEPERDTPEVLKDYVKMHGVGPGWTYLTGKPADIELLRRKLGFTNPNPQVDKDTSQHIGNLRYGNEPLMLWAACPGLASPNWIYESLSWVIRPQQSRRS